jgi:O-methyltransferase involved in polyketide biosynthesis
VSNIRGVWTDHRTAATGTPETDRRSEGHVNDTLAKAGIFRTAQAHTMCALAAQLRVVQRMNALTERWRVHGFDLDFTELVYLGDRNDAERYLNTHGCDTVGTVPADLFVANGLDPIHGDNDKEAPFASVTYLSATLK